MIDTRSTGLEVRINVVDLVIVITNAMSRSSLSRVANIIVGVQHEEGAGEGVHYLGDQIFGGNAVVLVGAGEQGVELISQVAALNQLMNHLPASILLRRMIETHLDLSECTYRRGLGWFNHRAKLGLD